MKLTAWNYGAIFALAVVCSLGVMAYNARRAEAPAPPSVRDMLHKAVEYTTPMPGDGVWIPPACPRELTLPDGTRWAPPKWSDPDCRIMMMWEIL